MIIFDMDIQWFHLLLPFFLYAEIHYRIWNIFSRYFKREPEIIADVPHRIGGQKLPVFICIKDADRYPVVLKSVKIEIVNDSNPVLLYEKDYPESAVAKPLWYDLLECDVDRRGDIKIDVTIFYSCRGKDKVCANDNYKLTSHAPFTVFVDPHHRPKLDGWVFGDMHTHSHLTDDQVEFGAPLDVSAVMARALELDFFAAADHSYDLDDRLDNYLINDPNLPKWKMMWAQIEKHNRENDDVVIIPGEELSAGNAKNKNVHYLIFNNKRFFPGHGDSAEKWFRTRPQHKISDVLPCLEKDALSFAAHPVIAPPFVQKLLIRRGIWTEQDLARAGLQGAQFWNGDKEHFLNVGLQKWIELLLAGHKITLIAGTDAHGNFNRFRQIGTPHLSMREEQRELFGTALTGVSIDGKYSLNSLLEGLRKGRAIVTDGPVAVMSGHPTGGDGSFAGVPSTKEFLIGDSVQTSAGTVHVKVSSSPSYGEIKSLVLVTGDTTAKKETQRRIITPLGCFSFSENMFFENPRQGYIRLEVETQIKDRSFHCFTNPIYFD